MRSTHTVASLEIPAEWHDWIRQQLEAAGYHHAIHEDDGKILLDMTGIGLLKQPEIPT